jgi:hypothetical protein
VGGSAKYCRHPSAAINDQKLTRYTCNSLNRVFKSMYYQTLFYYTLLGISGLSLAAPSIVNQPTCNNKGATFNVGTVPFEQACEKLATGRYSKFESRRYHFEIPGACVHLNVEDISSFGDNTLEVSRCVDSFNKIKNKCPHGGSITSGRIVSDIFKFT